MTTTDVSWPTASEGPYELTVETASVDLELSDDDSEFGRFERQVGTLVAVPKAEVDAERQKTS